MKGRVREMVAFLAAVAFAAACYFVSIVVSYSVLYVCSHIATIEDYLQRPGTD